MVSMFIGQMTTMQRVHSYRMSIKMAAFAIRTVERARTPVVVTPPAIKMKL